MAKVTNPLMSQDARGSVSGIQFSRNRSGNFGSRKSTSTRAQGDPVLAQRALLKTAHSKWLNALPLVRDSWDAFAPPPLTGRNWFIGCQLRLLAAGEDAPPVIPNRNFDTTKTEEFYWVQNQPGPDDYFLAPKNSVPTDGLMILSVSPQETHALPHVRKYSFVDAQWCQLYKMFFTKWFWMERLAIRVQICDIFNGILRFEGRWNINPHSSITLTWDS